jgi:hypothetical protein
VYAPRVFVNLGRTAEFQQRAAASLLRAHALRDLILRDAVNVILDFRFAPPFRRFHYSQRDGAGQAVPIGGPTW